MITKTSPAIDTVPLHNRGNPFGKHRQALQAVAPDATGANLRGVLREIGGADVPLFAEFLLSQGLGPYFHHLVQAHNAAQETPAGFLAALKRRRLMTTVGYLAQKSVLRELDTLFCAENIMYVAIKGAHVRERVYTNPALRSTRDIDILINPDQREAAARTLIRAGFKLFAAAENISHEASFTKNSVHIDLHWDILRPGRTRTNVVHSLLSARRRVDDFWGLDDSDTVFLMLVHPAFTKYVCSPNMGLNRVLDFILWTQQRPVNWDAVAERLNDTGLNTAAWTTLQWFAMLLEPEHLPVSSAFIARISPGWLRSRYLQYWLQHDLPTRWLRKPLRIQLGFTLFLHDRLTDAGHAISGWLRARGLRATDPLLRMLDEPG